MAASVDLTTLAKVKAYLGIPTADTSDDTWIDQLIDEASEWIENYCGREFAYGQKTEYYDGQDDTPNGRIFVKSGPIQTDVADILVRTLVQITAYIDVRDDVNLAWGAATEVAPANIQVAAEEGTIHVKQELARGTKNVKVVYYGGYNTIPTDLDLACQKVVAWHYNRGRSGSDGLASESESGMAARYVSQFPTPEVIALLAPYAPESF